MSSHYPVVDAFDRKILEVVQVNNMRPQREISEIVCLSVPAVARRLQRLRSDGVITADASVVRPEYVGAAISIIANVVLADIAIQQVHAMRQRFLDCPQVQQCYDVTGDIDFVLIILVRDMVEYEALCMALFYEGGNVRTFRTYVALQRVKTSLQVPIAPL